MIPPLDYGFLREAGVQWICGPGTKVVRQRRICCDCSGKICRRWRGERDGV